MKTFILSLTLLFSIVYHPVKSQEIKPNLLHEINQAKTEHSKKHNSSTVPQIQTTNTIDTILKDCWTLIKKKYTLAENYTSNFVLMPEGQTYTGSKQGIKMWDGYSDISITAENSNIPENNVTALAVDRQNNLWIGTYSSGVVLGIGDPVKPFKTRFIQTRDPNIFSIFADGDGIVWVVFRNGGFECFRNGLSFAYCPPQII